MKNLAIKVAIILLSAVFVSLILSHFSVLIQHHLKVHYNGFFELGVVLGQLVFQGIFIIKRSWKQILTYWLNVMMVSFSGALLLIPLLYLNSLFLFNDPVIVCCFFGVVLFMFFEHFRRIKKLQLPGYLSYTWVLYRCLILLLILQL